MILFKLLLIPMFILAVFGIIRIAKFFYKLADNMEVDEKKEDINHNAELVDDVKDFVDNNDDKIKKASSNIVKDFIKK